MGWAEGRPCLRRPPHRFCLQRKLSFTLPALPLNQHPNLLQTPGAEKPDLTWVQTSFRTKDFSVSFNTQVEAQPQARLGREGVGTAVSMEIDLAQFEHEFTTSTAPGTGVLLGKGSGGLVCVGAP